MANPIQEIYTSTGYDTSATTATTDSDSYELDAVTGASISGSNYVKIKMLGTVNISTSSSQAYSGNVTLKVEIKEVGGAYGDLLAVTAVESILKSDTSDSSDYFIAALRSTEVIGTITSGMKANGFQIRITSTSTSNKSNTVVSYTNVQTVVELA